MSKVWRADASLESDDEDGADEIKVTPDFDVEAVPLTQYYTHLDQRLGELQGLMGASGAALPSTYEKYLHGSMPAGAAGDPLVSAKEYYEQLKQLRADSQVYYPVASEVYRDLLWEDVDMADPVEYTYCRYTPITTEDARDFGSDGYNLRVQQKFSRHIKLLICVTLYNEDQETMGKTLLGICENLEVLYRQYGRDGNRHGLDWQEVAICIVQDGESACDASITAASTVQGFYSGNLKQEEAVGLPVSMHLWEYTARYKKHAGLDCYPPLQIMFASKTGNRGKLDSHCWFFDGFAYLLQPEYCVLFDAGTRPLPMALRNIYAHFKRNPWCGGLSGELCVERPFRNYLTMVQYMEWKMSHFLQKPIESLCGYLTVLPGAFSGFRWAAIEGEPLRRYFYGLYSQAELNAFEANMYLAEDRVLCLEIVAKKGCAYRLEYIKEAVAEADPVTKLTGLIKQRRRWLNGTFFAMLYALGNMGRIWTESAHSLGRKLVLTLEFFYLVLQLVVGTWFGIGIFYTLLYQLLKVAFDGPGWLQQLGNVVQLGYLFLLIVQLIINLKSKPESVEKIHSFSAIYFCLYMLVFTGVSISFLITNHDYSFMHITDSKLGLIVAILMSAIGGIILTSLLHGEILAIIGAGFQYWIMQPCFFNMLQMNAFCNADDISWGTKNLDTKRTDHETAKMASKALAYQVRPSKTSKAFWEAMGRMQTHLTDAKKIAAYNARKEQKLKAFAAYLLIAWVSTNVIFVTIILMFCNYTWESCAITESELAVNAIKSQAPDGYKALIMADMIQTAVTILQRGQQLYPFDGLQGFPQAYPMLVSGDAQSNTARGSKVTVLANATDLFANLDQSMPKFNEWLQESMGINATATLEEYNNIWLPMPSNTTNGYDAHVTCTVHSGYTYYLQAQFILLCTIVLFQVGGSVIFIFGYYWRRLSGAATGSSSMRRDVPSATPHMFPPTEGTASEFEIAIQPGSARYPGALPPAVFAAHGGDDDTPRSDNSPSAVRRRAGGVKGL